MKERPNVRTHVRRISSSNTVEDKGPLKKSYLGFKESYGPEDFSDRTYAYNSKGSLATRISALDWILSLARGKGDTVYPTPLSLKALGVHLGFIEAGQTLQSAGQGLAVRRPRRGVRGGGSGYVTEILREIVLQNASKNLYLWHRDFDRSVNAQSEAV